MRGIETARDGAREARILSLDTTEFFGPLMQVHGQIMKTLDPNTYRIFVATNTRSNAREQLRHLDQVVVKEYYLGGTLRGKHSVWQKAWQLLANFPVAFSFIKILRLIRREGIDLIHTASAPRMILVGSLLSLLSRAQLVVQVDEEPSHRFLRSSWVTFGLRQADAIITVSSFLKQRVAGLSMKSSKVWPILNRVNLERFHPSNDRSEIRRQYGLEPQRPVVVTVGRITPQKGQRDLLEALVMVKAGLS
jgi:glycosyltransferase involved in cell wall biosynthesis